MEKSKVDKAASVGNYLGLYLGQGQEYVWVRACSQLSYPWPHAGKRLKARSKSTPTAMRASVCWTL